jgi:hypothetical protein
MLLRNERVPWTNTQQPRAQRLEIITSSKHTVVEGHSSFTLNVTVDFNRYSLDRPAKIFWFGPVRRNSCAYSLHDTSDGVTIVTQDIRYSKGHKDISPVNVSIRAAAVAPGRNKARHFSHDVFSMSTTLVQSYLLPLLQSIRSKILAVEDDSGDDSIIQWWTRMLVHTPLFNNILVCLVTILYGKLGLLGVAWLMQRVGGGGGSIGSARMVALPIAGRSTALHHLYSKQLVYMLLAMSLLFWPLYDTSDWSWRLNAVFPTAMMIRFIIKVRKRKNLCTMKTLAT